MSATYESFIPAHAEEAVAFAFPNGLPALAEYFIAGVSVGRRSFNQDGNLATETPLHNGKIHGNCYRWYPEGTLMSLVPFEHGLQHGTAGLWSTDGDLLDTYTMDNGTGIRLDWRLVFNGDTSFVYLHRVDCLTQGYRHGVSWVINPDQHTISGENYYYADIPHGIERIWDANGRLDSGYPKFFRSAENLAGEQHEQELTLDEYLAACEADESLPIYREVDNISYRDFPEEVVQHLRA